MDLRVYYQKIRKLEAELAEPFAVIVSKETGDGGKAGIRTDVPKLLAARMVVEERADLASAEEAAQFRAEVEQKWREAQGIEAPRIESPKPKPVKKA
jgi:hypothetical protein